MSVPVITSVSWAADNLPPGITFNEATGGFSGMPTAAGDYTVPVSVKTEWGSDTEDVNIVVERRRVTSRFTVQAENNWGTDRKTYTITVWEAE